MDFKGHSLTCIYYLNCQQFPAVVRETIPVFRLIESTIDSEKPISVAKVINTEINED